MPIPAGSGHAALLPRVNPLLTGLLRPRLAPVNVWTRVPADWLARLPFLHVEGQPGGRLRGPRGDVGFDIPFQMDAYAPRLGEANQLLSDAHAILMEAWRLRTPVQAAGQVINRYRVPVPPFEVREPDQPDTFARLVMTGSLSVRVPVP